MRYKKTREVNIFSASVVDLFASGLGVFLIVAIIALVNQKKENSKPNAPPKDTQSAKIIAELESKVSELSEKIKVKQEENIVLRTQGAEDKEKAIAEKIKLEATIEKRLLEEQLQKVIDQQKEKIQELKAQYQSASAKVKDLGENLSSLKEMYQSMQNSSTASKEKALNLKTMEIGSKIQLNNVQFYAGTEKMIEPYASEEINVLARFLMENPTVKVEVSGHIFLSQKELEKGDVKDDFNLSGRRARVVCDKLQTLGVVSERLTCVGYGGQKYLYLTNDEYSREAQLNRRVEVEILSK